MKYLCVCVQIVEKPFFNFSIQFYKLLSNFQLHIRKWLDLK